MLFFPCSNCQLLTFFLCKCVLLYIYTVSFFFVFARTSACASHCPNNFLTWNNNFSNVKNIKLSTIIFEYKCGFPCSKSQFLTFILYKSVLFYIYAVFSCISTHFPKTMKHVRALAIGPTISFTLGINNNWLYRCNRYQYQHRSGRFFLSPVTY